MTAYNILMGLGAIAILAIIAKGFFAGDRVKPKEQPDNWRQFGGPPHGGD